MRLPILALMATSLLSSAAHASALHRMETKFASMTADEVVVRNKSGKKIRLHRELIKKSDLDLLSKKSNGKFVTISVLSRAIIKEKGK